MRLNVVCYSLLGLALIASFFCTHPIGMWLFLVTLLTFLVYGADKFAARKGWQRVPEVTLLVLGLVGGWIGAIFGQQLFRHKTQKQPFRTWFMLSIAVNIVAVLGAGYWMYGRWVL